MPATACTLRDAHTSGSVNSVSARVWARRYPMKSCKIQLSSDNSPAWLQRRSCTTLRQSSPNTPASRARQLSGTSFIARPCSTPAARACSTCASRHPNSNTAACPDASRWISPVTPSRVLISRPPLRTVGTTVAARFSDPARERCSPRSAAGTSICTTDNAGCGTTTIFKYPLTSPSPFTTSATRCTTPWSAAIRLLPCLQALAMMQTRRTGNWRIRFTGLAALMAK
mmetsp:Transcript_2381/g.5401  ORF Transcript_2381/g.5401 Transcript_2381/m.5401 type:complete len:227 (-) Transcript_2381:466-1146(-)